MTDTTKSFANRRLFTGSHAHPYLDAGMDNILAAELGMVGRKLSLQLIKCGDNIDCGLVLRRLLEEAGFYLSLKDQS